MPRLLLATGNAAKLARLHWLLDGLPFEPIPLAACQFATGAPGDIEEDGSDFAVNAALKAAAWSGRAGGILTLSSDGGMRIPALGAAWDAVHTRRNAGPSATDAERIAHLLALMRDLKGEDRHAYWHEALAIARHGAILRTWTDSGDGGYIATRHVPSGADTAFWTESVRFYPAAGKLYRDFSPAERDLHDTVWPALRSLVRTFLLALDERDV